MVLIKAVAFWGGPSLLTSKRLIMKQKKRKKMVWIKDQAVIK